MRNRPVKTIAILFLSLVLTLCLVVPSAERRDGECFTVLVGKAASADDSVMIGHNEDDRGDIIVNVRKIQPHDYGKPRKVDLGKGAFFETDGRTNGFLWIEATTQEFADSFVNEHGVVITSDSCPSLETKDDLTDGGIGYMLRRIVAEKAKSAREGVRIAGDLIEKYGYRASGRTYAILDKEEAWMLAVIRGKHWYAQRVPDDEVAVIPNHYTIRQIRPENPEHFMGSRDIIEYARTNGRYDETKDGPFDFKKAFARPSRRDPVSDGNTLRHWRGLALLTGKEWPISDDYPFSAKPGKKVTVEALMRILRDHYEGTEYDATDGYKTGNPNRTKFRTICTASTINAFVVSLDSRRPEPIAASVWLAFGKPDTTVFLPLYNGVENLPPGAGVGTLTHDDEVFHKQHFDDPEFKAAKGGLFHTKVLELEKAVEADYGAKIDVLRRELFPVEKDFLENRPKFEADYGAVYARDKKKALEMLDAYVASAFERVTGLYKTLLT
ncbi:MAG: C69 family dipeptidase, partial [Candidatus Aminicenantales bacterium]